MRSFEYVLSSSTATRASLSFRLSVFSRVSRSGKTLRASCIVMVEKPCPNDSERMFALSAPKMREKSIPWCA